MPTAGSCFSPCQKKAEIMRSSAGTAMAQTAIITLWVGEIQYTAEIITSTPA